MNEQERKEMIKMIVEGLNETLEARDRLDHDTHKAHHAYIQMQIDKQARRQQVTDWCLKAGLGAATVTGLAFVGKLLWWIGGLLLAAITVAGASK